MHVHELRAYLKLCDKFLQEDDANPHHNGILDCAQNLPSSLNSVTPSISQEDVPNESQHKSGKCHHYGHSDLSISSSYKPCRCVMAVNFHT